MSQTGWDKDTSPLHDGEHELQARTGRSERMEMLSRKMIRSYMPEQHREFFSQRPFMVVGSVDHNGAPWASIIYGKPGFVTSPNDRRLVFNAAPIDGDPLADNLKNSSPIGLLGIEPDTRRRNRMNGTSKRLEDGHFAVNVSQSFGNCPKYIQGRTPQFRRNPSVHITLESQRFKTLDNAAVAHITQSDTFFVASHNHRDDETDTGGADVSHRGGRPGFVKVDGDVLTIPDFVGNYVFNTFGNFMVNPRAGLIFVDYESGDHLMMTGHVELLWEPTPEIEAFDGAQRAWRFTLEHGVLIRSVSPLNWSFGEISPYSDATGQWAK